MNAKPKTENDKTMIVKQKKMCLCFFFVKVNFNEIK